MIKRLIRYKVYFDRARTYIGYAQFIMMLLVMLKVYEDSSWGMWLFRHPGWIALFITILFGLLVVVGYLDRKFIRPKEVSEINKVNPELMEIKDNVNKILDKID